MNYLKVFWEQVLNSIPNILAALLLLLIAYILANVTKNLVIKAIRKLNLEEKLNRLGTQQDQDRFTEFLGQLAFILVFLLFLPSVFEKLGVTVIALPITSLVSQVLDWIPNILASGLILFLGIFVANLIKQVMPPLLRTLRIDQLQEKLGIEKDTVRLSNSITSLVYILFLIPVVIASLQTLGISALADPATTMLQNILAFAPRIFIALVLLYIGFYISKMIGNLVSEFLRGIGFDDLINKLSPNKNIGFRTSTSKMIGNISQIILNLFFLVEAFNVLGLNIFLTIGASIIAFIPDALIVLLIIFSAKMISEWSEYFLKNKNSLLKKISTVAIYLLAIFMILSHLNIASDIVDTAFILLLGAVAVAFALAFGLGGKEFAAKQLNKLDKKYLD